MTKKNIVCGKMDPDKEFKFWAAVLGVFGAGLFALKLCDTRQKDWAVRKSGEFPEVCRLLREYANMTKTEHLYCIDDHVLKANNAFDAIVKYNDQYDDKFISKLYGEVWHRYDKNNHGAILEAMIAYAYREKYIFTC